MALQTSMTRMEELARFILSDAKGCPPEVAIPEVVAVVGEFCKYTQIWRVEGEPIPIQNGTHTYVTPAPPNTLPETIIEAAIQASGQTNWRPLAPATEAQLGVGGGVPYHQGFFGAGGGTDWKSRTGTPRHWLHEFDPAFFRLVPTPTSTDAGGLVRVTVAVWPDLTAQEFPTWIYKRYYDGLSCGVLARLYGMKGEGWSDQARAQQEQAWYEAAMGEASNKVQKNFTKARLRVEPRERFA